LMGGQACVFYGAAEFSRDTDLAILASSENLARLNKALKDLQAEVIDNSTIELMSLPDLVQAKKTQRDKDWPMLRRLVEAHYFEHRNAANPEQVAFWLRQLRTPELLTEVAERWPRPRARERTYRPLLALADRGREAELAGALSEEEWAERRADALYWKPLKAELERLRLAKARRRRGV